MPALETYEVFGEDIFNGLHDFTSDSFKVCLHNTASNLAADNEFSDISEITAEGNYSAGGAGFDVALSRSGSVVSISASSVTFTGTDSGFGPFRYATLYNVTSGRLVGRLDYGSSVEVFNGESVVVSLASVGQVIRFGPGLIS